MKNQTLISLAFEACSCALNICSVLEDNRIEDEEGYIGTTSSEYLALSSSCTMLREVCNNIETSVLGQIEDTEAFYEHVGKCYPHLFDHDDDDSQIVLDGLRKHLYWLHTSLARASRIASAFAS